MRSSYVMRKVAGASTAGAKKGKDVLYHTEDCRRACADGFQKSWRRLCA